MCVLELWSLLSLPRLWALPCCPCALRGSQPRAAVLLGDQSESSTPSVPPRAGRVQIPPQALLWPGCLGITAPCSQPSGTQQRFLWGSSLWKCLRSNSASWVLCILPPPCWSVGIWTVLAGWPHAGGIPMVCAGHDTSCSLTGQGGTAPQGHTKHWFWSQTKNETLDFDPGDITRQWLIPSKKNTKKNPALC